MSALRPPGVAALLLALASAGAHAQSAGTGTHSSHAIAAAVDSAGPPTTTLYQNFPNPFPRPELGPGASTTHIWFDLRAAASVTLAIYDLHGRLVRRLIPAPGCGQLTLQPGLYGRAPAPDSCVRTSWDGTDDFGRRMPRGVYLLRLRADGTSQTRHIVFLP